MFADEDARKATIKRLTFTFEGKEIQRFLLGIMSKISEMGI